MSHASGQVVARDQVCRIKGGLTCQVTASKCSVVEYVDCRNENRRHRWQRSNGPGIKRRKASQARYQHPPTSRVHDTRVYWMVRSPLQRSFSVSTRQPTTLPPSTERRRPELSLRGSMLKSSRVSGYVRALHACLPPLVSIPCWHVTAVCSRRCICHLLAQS